MKVGCRFIFDVKIKVFIEIKRVKIIKAQSTMLLDNGGELCL